MSQIKITSFFTKINQQSTNQQSDKQDTSDCEENNNKNVNYDSDITDIYDYEGDIAVLDDKINEKQTKKKEKKDEIVCDDDDNNKKELNDEQQQVQVVRRGRGRPRKIKVEIKVQPAKASSSSSNSEEENKNESTTKKRLKSDVDGKGKSDGKQDESAIVIENKDPVKLNSTNSSFHKLWAKTDQPKSGEDHLTEQMEKNKKKEKKNDIAIKDTTNEKEPNNGQVARRGRGRPRKVKVELIKSSPSNSEDDSKKVPKAKKLLKSIDKPMNGKDSKNNDKHNESVILVEEKAPKILKSDLNGKEKSDKQDESSESKCPVKSNSTNSFLKQWVKAHQPKSGEELTEQAEKKKKEKKNDIVKDDKMNSNSGQVERRGRGRPRKVKVELIKSSSSSNTEDDSGEKAKKILKSIDKPKMNGKSENDKQNESVILIEDTSPVKPPVIPIPLPTHSYLKLWTETHQPKSSADLIDHSVQVETFKQWLCVWHETFNNASNSDSDSDEDNSSAQGFIDGKCFYIHGQNGVGKTSLVFTVASELGYKVLEYNATAQRFTPTLIQKELSHSLQSYYINNQQQSQKGSVFNLFNQKKNAPTVEQSKVKLSKSLILIDDLDGIIYENANFTELWRSLKQMIADARKPIVFTSSFEANFLCCNEQHYFTAVKLDSIAQLSVGQLLNRVSRQKDEENESTEIADRFENSFVKNFFDGDARKLLNQAQFWHYGNDDDDKPVDTTATSTKPEDSKLSVYNLSTNVALLDLLSLEDIYQTEFDQLWVECTDFDERAYNSYLYDNRMSLLFTNSESPIINRAQSNLTNSFDDTLKSYSTLTEQQTSMQSICQLLRDHYLQLDSKQSGLFSDCFAFFCELSAMHPAVIEEIQCSKQSANSSTINSATRSKRRSKASCAFAYL